MQTPEELYHSSEQSGLDVFEPRLIPTRPEVTEPLVWAVDAEHAFTYCFPRDCPRIVIWRLPTSTDADWQYWLGASTVRAVAHIEYAWLERMRTTRLFRYRLAGDAFEVAGAQGGPGNYVSRSIVTASGVDVLDDLFEVLRAAGVELRVLDRLAPLRSAWDSTLQVSGFRLRNAQDWPG